MTLTLGIDVAKAKLDVALRLPTGQIRSTIIANTDAGFVELQAWLAPHDVVVHPPGCGRGARGSPARRSAMARSR